MPNTELKIKIGYSILKILNVFRQLDEINKTTKAAIKEGIVAGGGIALLNASTTIKPKDKSEEVLLKAIQAPFKVILKNAGIETYDMPKVKGKGLDVVTGNMVNMIKSGIIDPLLVTKSALRNAASVATTILSTDCVINNLRIDESNR